MKLNALKQRFLTLNPLAIFYYFCLSVIIVRGGIFLSIILEHVPAIYVRGWHIHHFVFGFLLLVVVVDEFARKKMPRWMAELLLGLSFGLIFDEFAFWSMARFDYWSMSNFFAMVFLGVAAGILSQISHKPYHINFRHKITKRHTHYAQKFSFRRQVMLPWASFVCILLVIFSLN